MKKHICILIVLLVLSIFLPACQNSTSSSVVSTTTPLVTDKTTQQEITTAPGNVSDLPAYGDYSEKVTLSWYIAGDATTYKEDNIVAQTINERFNVEISTPLINGFEDEKMNTILASGEIPDVFIRWGSGNYYKDGIIRTITKDLIATYMPKSYNIIEEEFGLAAWDAVTVMPENVIIGVPQTTVYGDQVISLAIRKDWLDNLDMQIPKTIDDLTEVFEAFTNNDPDGNGEKDTFGITAPGLHGNPLFAGFPTIFGAYGVIPTKWTLDENGKVAYCCVQEGYKQALKQLNAWYEAELIDPEFITTDNATFGTKLDNGIVGVWDCVPPTYLSPTAPTGHIALTKSNDPDAEWILIPPIVGPTGKSGGSTYGAVGSWSMMYGAKTTDEQVVRAMQIADAINTERDLFTLTYMGIEGVTYDLVNGVAVAKSGINLPEYGANVFRTGSVLTWENTELILEKSVIDIIQESLKWPCIRNVINVSNISGVIDMDKVDSAEMTKVVNEFYFNAITGYIDIDAEWDAYVSKWKSLGGELMTEGAQQLPIINVNE